MRSDTGIPDRGLAHAILRLTLGINIAIHGFHRLPIVRIFTASTVHDFRGILPENVVTPFATVLPYAETLIGALIVLGIFQRPVLAIGALLMAALTFGTALRGEYLILTGQLGYELVYFVLLATREWDAISFDSVIRRRVAIPGRR